MNNADDLANWLTPLIRQLEPGQRTSLAREIGRGLRQRQALRIKQQENPDGSQFEPRKPRTSGKRGEMFRQLRKYKYLKFKARSGEVSTGWFGYAAFIARIHQYGLEGKVDPRYSQTVQYPLRELLGLSDADVEWLQDTVLAHLDKS